MSLIGTKTICAGVTSPPRVVPAQTTTCGTCLVIVLAVLLLLTFTSLDWQGVSTSVPSHALAPASDLGGAKRGPGTGILTNISGARFSKNATSAGMTITFGQPPPNVTVSNSSVPPPLTKIGMEGGAGSNAGPTSVLVEGKHPGPPPHGGLSGSGAAGVPPPPYSSSATAVRSRPNHPPTNFTTPTSNRPPPPTPQSVNPVAGGRALAPGYPAASGILPPQQSQQNLLPQGHASAASPPPLLHSSRPSTTRSRTLAVPTSSVAPGPPPRSFQPRFTGPVGGTPRGPRPVGVGHPHPLSSPPPLSAAPGPPGTLIHHVPSSASRRTIMPNFHGAARGVAPGMPRGTASNPGGPFMVSPSMGARRFPVASQRSPTISRASGSGQQVRGARSVYTLVLVVSTLGPKAEA